MIILYKQLVHVVYVAVLQSVYFKLKLGKKDNNIDLIPYVTGKIVNNKVDISTVFTFSKTLGNGRMGCVKEGYLSTDTTKTKLAIKIISIDKLCKESIEYQEPFMLLKFDHPNILKLAGMYKDECNVYMATEYCEGTALFEKMPEEVVRELAFQMLYALVHIHEKRICHLDIKPINFILKSKEPKSLLKLIDFEFAADILKDSMIVPRGTLGYMAPELLEGLCGLSCDMWSLGITLYYLLSGEEPFKCKNHIEASTFALTKKIPLEGRMYF
jgi:serine/threonine protein kinase